MLLRLDNPRLVINAQEFPEHVVIMALRYDDAPGEVTVSYLDVNSHARGNRATHPVQPTRRLDIMDGMVLHEFVLPFRDLHDPLGRRGATGGFQFTANSAFRHQTSYGVRTLDFTMQFPVIGGGLIRFSIGGQEWELANPTFHPLAALPEINSSYGQGRGDEYISGPPGIENKRVPDDVLVNAYRRTHAGYTRPGRAQEIERRRQERIANFDLQEAPPGPETEEGLIQTDALEGGSYRDPPRRIPVPPGVIIESSDPVEQRRQARLAQIQQAEEKNPSILLGPTRAPKAPPRTRFERDEDD